MLSAHWPVYSPFAKEHFGRGFAEGFATGFAEGMEEGRAAGMATALLKALDARRIDVPGDLRTRITTCTDPARLDTWLTRVLSIPTLDDLFGEDGETAGSEGDRAC
ncbi:hypothetical protein AB0K67_28705 [Nonomuraea sp. NPDC052634]|uniref:hypothetical protein n=1 Tax=Nonomuraea sp. NPDC052634 TaxID=3155813 RepID=UPI00341E903E